MQEYSPNESQYSKQQIYGYNHRKLKIQKQNTKIDVWIIMQTDTERLCQSVVRLTMYFGISSVRPI